VDVLTLLFGALNDEPFELRSETRDSRFELVHLRREDISANMGALEDLQATYGCDLLVSFDDRSQLLRRAGIDGISTSTVRRVWRR